MEGDDIMFSKISLDTSTDFEVQQIQLNYF